MSTSTNRHPAQFLVLDGLNLLEILRVCCTFLCIGFVTTTFLQYCGEIVKYHRARNPGVVANFVAEDLIAVPFFVGIGAVPIWGLVLDYLESKRTLTTATMLALVGCFALGQNPGYFSAFLLFLGVNGMRLSIAALVQQTCKSSYGQDRYGKAFCLAAALELVGVFFGLQVTNLSWAAHYVAGSSKCVGMCVDFKFAFHLCLPVITVLCVSLALLTRIPQVTVLANSSAPRSPSASLQGRQVLRPRSISGARLFYVVAAMSWCGWGALLWFGALFVTKELYLVFNVFRDDVRVLGNPMLSSPLPLTDPGKQSFALVSHLSYTTIISSIVGCFLLLRFVFLNNRKNYLITKLYSDVGNNLLCANLLLPFLFTSYPLKFFLYCWAASLGLCLAMQLCLPPLIVTRFVDSNSLPNGNGEEGSEENNSNNFISTSDPSAPGMVHNQATSSSSTAGISNKNRIDGVGGPPPQLGSSGSSSSSQPLPDLPSHAADAASTTTVKPPPSEHRHLAGLLFCQNLAIIAAKSIADNFAVADVFAASGEPPSHANCFVLFATVLFTANLLLANKLATKEEELARVKMGLAMGGGTGVGVGGRQQLHGGLQE
ncbi:unnamed protein product [Amoebophrya sp. A120]|nr:unnamed protein product [Amoebophrya sp. A120]|eukprot:GSA120T00000067001.1